MITVDEFKAMARDQNVAQAKLIILLVDTTKRRWELARRMCVTYKVAPETWPAGCQREMRTWTFDDGSWLRAHGFNALVIGLTGEPF